MKVEFNIRLDSPMHTRCSAKLVKPTVSLMRDTFNPSVMDFTFVQRQVESERNDMLELQDILVVRMDTTAPMNVISEVMYAVCMNLHQACVAIFFPSHGKGMLTGPDTAAFAPFDAGKFIMFGEVAA